MIDIVRSDRFVENNAIAANGVSVYYYKQPNTHSICVSLYIKTGTLYDDENPGITHFLEHLHFRRLGGRTQKELYYELEHIGGYFGARTYKEFMQFYLTSSPKYFPELARIGADLLGKLEADLKDFRAEKEIILSEIREDEQVNDVNFASDKIIWKDTGLQYPVLGSISSIKKLTLPVLQAEKEKTFTRDNLFYYVTGCFSDNDIARLIAEIDRYDLSDRHNSQNDNMAQIPPGFRHRNALSKISQRKFDMHDVNLSFDIDFTRVSRYELLYLDSILTDGLCSLLRSELIEKKGLLYGLSSTIEQYQNVGVYHFSFSVYKSKLYDVVRTFIAVLQHVKHDIAEDDMKATRVFKTDNQTMLLDSPEDLNWQFAYENHILEGQYNDIAELADIYRQIGQEQLVKLANKIFIPENAVLVSLGKKKGLSESILQEIIIEGLN